MEIDRERLVGTIQEQAEIGATEGGGLHRLALSEADREVRDWFVDRLEAAGLSVRIDAFGNVFGRRKGTDPDAAPVLLGSHLDSQPYGGIRLRVQMPAALCGREFRDFLTANSLNLIRDSLRHRADHRPRAS